MGRRKVLLLIVMLFCSFSISYAQNKTVTGKVIDEEGQPFFGVSIAIKGTTIGTISGENGVYIIQVPDRSTSDTIVYSYIGYAEQLQPIAGRSVIDVTMQKQNIEFEEVVVTALGIDKSRKAIGYAATQVSADEIANAKTSNLMASIAGKVAGVEIISNAGPGSSQNIMIRGAASLSNNQPLYIVDGVPILGNQKTNDDNLNFYADLGTGINSLNPNDIESMTVLKGAAATALYGSRATNGVIMITTKSGHNTNGKMIVTYDGSLSVQRVGYLPEVQNQFGQGWDGKFSREENGNWGPRYTGQYQTWGYIVDNQQQVAKYEFLENRTRDFYELGFSNSHSVSASGGNENTTYYMSISNDHENGVIPEDYDTYNRTTISIRGSHKWNKVLVSSILNFANEKTLAVPTGQTSSMAKDLWDVPLHISLVDFKDLDNKFNQNSNYFTLFGVNPYYMIENDFIEMHRNKVFGKVQADIEIYKDLKLTYRFGGDLMNIKTDVFRNMRLYEEGSPQYDYLSSSGSKDPTIGEPGLYEYEKQTRYEINNDVFFTYTKALNQKWNISAIVGLNVQEIGYNQLRNKLSELQIPNFVDLSNSSADPKYDRDESKIRRVGLYANVDIDFNRMLYLTLTVRNDWSSTLPLEDNSYIYPGATLAWIFTELGDGGHLGPLTFGKLRLSYGWTGKDVDPYFVYSPFVVSNVRNPGFEGISDFSFPIGGSQAWQQSNTKGNEKIKPELTNEFEIGGELIFFNGRIGIDGAYYNKYTKDLLSRLYLDYATGFSNTYANIGDIRNSGYELAANFTPIKRTNFAWRISGNFSQNFNKVEKLKLDEIYLEGFSGVSIYAVEGRRIGQFKASKATEVIDDKTQEHYILVNEVGNPVATADPVFVNKDVNEKWRLGLTNRFEYKGFSLEGTLDLHYGGYMYMATRRYLGWTGAGYFTTNNARNPFVVPNSVVECSPDDAGAIQVTSPDGSHTFVKENTTAVAPFNSSLCYFYESDGFDNDNENIIKRSYLKLRNISFAYSLPKNVVAKVKLQDVKLSLTAANILLWTPKENVYVDPECSSFNNSIGAKFGEYFSNPTNQVYTFGVSVKF